MKAVVLALALATLVPAASPAQPLEQSFAFGAPLGVLGNDRFRAGRTGPERAAARPARPGDVAVRLGRRGDADRTRRWN